MKDEIESRLNEIEVKVERDIPLGRYTTWKVGGPADLLIWPESEDKLKSMIEVLSDYAFPYFILGNGSNVLVADKGVRGAVVRLTGTLAKINVEEEMVRAGGGALLSSVVARSFKKSLGGLEFTFGIPGTVGGAVMMNAGAFKKNIANVLSQVKTIDRNGETKVYEKFKNEYRTALVPKEETVVSALFSLKQRKDELIKKKMDDFRKQRRKTQPWGMPTAGSVFKNPEGDYAGRLIEECGLKGKTMGSARISETHSNFIINEGEATANDIKELMDLIVEEVLSNFEIELKPEVQFLGFGPE